MAQAFLLRLEDSAGQAARALPLDLHRDTTFGPGLLAGGDVTEGGNKVGAIGFSAGLGCDACAGLGSPNGERLRANFTDAPT